MKNITIYHILMKKNMGKILEIIYNIKEIKYYNNQYDSFNSLQINRNLFNQLILKQEKEQIKQFLKKELQNEQRKFTYNLIPKIKTIDLSKYKKEAKENTNIINHKTIVISLLELM